MVLADQANVSSAGAVGKTTPKLPALTGLRIVAAVAVYMSHLADPTGAPRLFNTFINSGYMGVTVFFVLSGFVLTITYFNRLDHPSGKRVWQFVVARFARIYPIYILILGYIILREHMIGGSLAHWWEHVLAIQAWSPSTAVADGFNGPAWSVSVEIFLYACFPLLVLALKRVYRIRTICAIAASVVLVLVGLVVWSILTKRSGLPITDPQSAHRWLYETPLTRLGDFMLGILAARLYEQTRARPRVARSGGPLAVGAALVILGLMLWPAMYFSAWSWDVGYALPAVLLIFGLAVAPSSAIARLLSLPAMVLLGESSYAFYLVHQQALVYFGAVRWSVDLSITTLLFAAFTMGAIMCLAIGLHMAIERPARLYIRRVLGASPRAAWARRSAAVGLPDSAVLPDAVGAGAVAPLE